MSSDDKVPFSFSKQIYDNNLDLSLLQRHIAEKIKGFIQTGKDLYAGSMNFIVNTDTGSVLKRVGTLGTCMMEGEYQVYVLSKDENTLLNLHLSDRSNYLSLQVRMTSSSQASIADTKTVITQLFEDVQVKGTAANINWFFSTAQGLQSAHMSEVLTDEIHPEAYPFIEDLDAYIDRYLASSSQALLLMGRPGTGKTRLIRYMLQRIGQKYKANQFSVAYTNDPQALESDQMFIEFLTQDYEAMVLEDIDFNLMSRKEGNTVMPRLLNTADGLVANIGKKIILSTNLPSIRDIDDALVRPGRCHDVLKTRYLTQEESQALLDKIKKDGASDLPDKEKFTLAEIYQAANY